MTPEQAIEAAKGLTFEKVWAALMESRQQMAEYQKESQKRDEESQKRDEESQKRAEESWQQMRESQQELKQRMDESQQRIEKNLADLEKKLDKSIGGLGNALGRLTEVLFSAELPNKFHEHGFPFKTQTNRKRYYENSNVIAEVDSILENGMYVMLVEIKANLTINDVREHLQRIEIIRKHMNLNGDHRIIVGAVVGGDIYENALKHARVLRLLFE